MKILVCGSRRWLEQKPIERELKKLPRGTILIHGGCRGADNIAGLVGKILGFEVRVYPITKGDWARLGRGAGVIRNQQMLDKEHTNDEPIDRVLAFHEDLAIGTGTADMVRRSEEAGIPVEVFTV